MASFESNYRKAKRARERNRKASMTQSQKEFEAFQKAYYGTGTRSQALEHARQNLSAYEFQTNIAPSLIRASMGPTAGQRLATSFASGLKGGGASLSSSLKKAGQLALSQSKRQRTVAKREKRIATAEKRAVKERTRAQRSRQAFQGKLQRSLRTHGEGLAEGLAEDNSSKEYKKAHRDLSSYINNKVFMAATVEYWRGYRSEDRLDAIVRGIARDKGVDPSEINLAAEKKAIMRENKDVVKIYMENVELAFTQGLNTSDEDFQQIVKQSTQDYLSGSPIELGAVILYEPGRVR